MPRFICVRIIVFFAIIMAMVVVGVCGWTLANTLRFGEIVKQKIDLNQPEVNGTEISNYDNYTSIVDKSDEGRRPKFGPNSTGHRPGMTRRYKLLIQTSVAVSIFASLVQLLSSIVLLGTAAKHMRIRTRFWQLTNFIVILCLVMCILVPLSYNRDKDTFRGMISFGSYMKKELISFYQGIQDSGGGRIGSYPSIFQFLLAGLNLYYIVITSNVILLILFIVFSFCCNLCTSQTRNYHRSVY